MFIAARGVRLIRSVSKMASGGLAADGLPPTIFHKIVDKSIPSTKVWEDEKVYAFRDIAPTAPVHVVIVPKERDGLTGLSAAQERHREILGHLMWAASQVAAAEGLDKTGFRIVVNDGTHGCTYKSPCPRRSAPIFATCFPPAAQAKASPTSTSTSSAASSSPGRRARAHPRAP
jgi:HIT domain